MPLEDAHRWNTRYQHDLRDSFTEPRSLLVDNAHLLPTSGLAIDLAMGLGGNAAFLIEYGLQVIGVDISDTAIRNACESLPQLIPVIADLTNFFLPVASFNVIINFFYLQRDLWPLIALALKPGGILIYETLTIDMQVIHPEIDPEFLLLPGELAQAFPGLQTITYKEGWQNLHSRHPRPVASLVARRPG